jgi:OmpA-OmpF porin, OOP family
MRRRRRVPCWVWSVPVALALLALSTCVPGKRIVDGALERQARKALVDNGVDGVRVDFDWAKGVLTGPPDLENSALAVVGVTLGTKKVYSLRYVAEGEPSATTTTTTPAITTTAAPAATTAAGTTVAPSTTAASTTVASATTTTTAAVTALVQSVAEVSGNQITLTGRVATAGVRDSIVAAASAAFRASKVVDKLTVAGPGAPTPTVLAAVDRYATLLGAAGPRLGQGTVSITDTAITAAGTAFNPQAARELDGAVAQANGDGISVTGSFQSAAADRATLQAQLQALLGRSGINFASGSAEIDDPSRDVLDTAAASILALPGILIAIDGHTDNVGSAASNQTLSQRRAEAVAAYLVGRGVGADQLTATGYGAEQPIADNTTADGRAANRRIEFAVTGS